MYDSAQIKIVLRLTGHAFIIFVALNITMWVTTTLSPGFLSVPKQFFGVDFVKKNFQKVHNLINYYENDLNDRNNSLIVFLGLSGASEGIKIEALQPNFNDKADLVSLSGAGRNIKEISIYAEPLIKSALRPDLVIFAISPFHLMEPPADKRNLWNILQETPKHHLFAGWFLLKRNDLKHLIDMEILKIRMTIYDWLDYRISENIDRSWQQDTLMGMIQLRTKEDWDSRLKEYGERGYYNLDNYRNSQNQILLFTKLIKQFQNKGSEIIVLLMPEHSSLGQKIPQQAMQTLLALLTQQLPNNEMPAIMDFRQTVADNGFTDISHLNSTGRDLFTIMLNKLIGENIREL